VAQEVESLSGKCEALSSSLSTKKKERKKNTARRKIPYFKAWQQLSLCSVLLACRSSSPPSLGASASVVLPLVLSFHTESVTFSQTVNIYAGTKFSKVKLVFHAVLGCPGRQVRGSSPDRS
jgi:hypothetical protein